MARHVVQKTLSLNQRVSSRIDSLLIRVTRPMHLLTLSLPSLLDISLLWNHVLPQWSRPARLFRNLLAIGATNMMIIGLMPRFKKSTGQVHGKRPKAA